MMKKLVISFAAVFAISVFVCPVTGGRQLPAYSAHTDLHDINDYDELKSFMDDFMQDQLEEYHIPGAALAIVKDDDVLLAGGYGYADLESQQPVSADETLFRVGSVSKLFTWTAVMQLVERGQLDVNADVNTYLPDFRIPDTFTEPVTLSHLLTHTAGFAAKYVDTEARNARDLRSLHEVVIKDMPDRARSPGELTAYSNYGAALAGYIVERTSGIPFNEFIEENIFRPLGITRSTFRQPLPPEYISDRATGYFYQDGILQAGQFQYFQLVPANSMSSTAVEIAQFMVMHLQNGRYGNKRILQELSALEMQRQQFTNDPRLPGMTYGFQERDLNGQRLLVHSGGTRYFSSLVALLPEQNTGLFVSYNCGNKGAALEALIRAFLDRYYPIPDPVTSTMQDANNKYAGVYRPTNRTYTTFERVAELFSLTTVKISRDGTLLVEQHGTGPRQYIETAPMVFRGIGTRKVLVFRENSQGSISNLFDGGTPQAAYVKLSIYETPFFHCTVLGICALIFLSVLRSYTRVFRKNNKKRTGLPGALLPRLAHYTVVIISLLNTLAVGILFIQLSRSEEIAFGVPWLVYAGLTAAVASAIFTVCLFVLTVVLLKTGHLKRWTGIRYVLVTVAALVFVWQLFYFNLLGFHF
ncbi:MAG TPA: beta-lactamase family protein [Dehalococcoidia bacterium]|nr:beta-lactamase family protein [Dehalococcoidia bacterium]